MYWYNRCKPFITRITLHPARPGVVIIAIMLAITLKTVAAPTARELVDDGRNAWYNDQIEKAINCFNAAIEADPGYPYAHYWRGRILMELRDWQRNSATAQKEINIYLDKRDKEDKNAKMAQQWWAFVQEQLKCFQRPPGAITNNEIDGAEMVEVPSLNPLDAYRVYRYEVTVAQYQKFCDATGRPMPVQPTWNGKDTHPMVNVTWQDAADYAAWAGVSLPSEARWEKAARGGDGRRYPWGGEWPIMRRAGNYGDALAGIAMADPYDTGHKYYDGCAKTAPVGSFLTDISPYGVLDMMGNVREWCTNWYSPNDSNPQAGVFRAVRGASFLTPITDLSCTKRDSVDPKRCAEDLGFRCVETARDRAVKMTQEAMRLTETPARRAQLATALQVDPTYPYAQLKYGMALAEEAGDLRGQQLAIDTIKKALQADAVSTERMLPAEVHDALVVEARCYAEIGYAMMAKVNWSETREEAMNMFAEALKLDTDGTQLDRQKIDKMRARIFEQNGYQYMKAVNWYDLHKDRIIEAFEMAIRLDPNVETINIKEIHRREAQIYEKDGYRLLEGAVTDDRRNQAEVILRKALEYDQEGTQIDKPRIQAALAQLVDPMQAPVEMYLNAMTYDDYNALLAYINQHKLSDLPLANALIGLVIMESPIWSTKWKTARELLSKAVTAYRSDGKHLPYDARIKDARSWLTMMARFDNGNGRPYMPVPPNNPNWGLMLTDIDGIGAWVNIGALETKRRVPLLLITTFKTADTPEKAMDAASLLEDSRTIFTVLVNTGVCGVIAKGDHVTTEGDQAANELTPKDLGGRCRWMLSVNNTLTVMPFTNDFTKKPYAYYAKCEYICTMNDLHSGEVFTLKGSGEQRESITKQVTADQAKASVQTKTRAAALSQLLLVIQQKLK